MTPRGQIQKNVYGAHTLNSIKQMDCLLRSVNDTVESKIRTVDFNISAKSKLYSKIL